MTWLHTIKYKIAFFLVILLGLMGISTQLNDFEITKNLGLFANIYRELNTAYEEDIDPEYLMKIGAKAMLNSLDPYTTFIAADEVGRFRSSITGKYGGIGAAIFEGKDYIIISMPYENSPAHKAGLKAGDKIVSIEGKSMQGKKIQDISFAMRGLPQTKVHIKIKRYGIEPLLNISLTREEIKVNNVPHYGVIQNNTAYIKLSSFSENAGKNVAQALTYLQEKYTIKNVILDLRNNTGGLLTEAVNVSNVFLEKNQSIVSIKGRDKSKDRVFRTLNAPIDTEIPLTILINKYSASASEIVAGAIQDYDRGVIIGERSYGKGLVQNTRDVGYGAKIKMTTARYYIPSGRCIQALNYKNGQPQKIPDSLRVAYQTKGGRNVYDGGGIHPDILIDKTAFYAILNSLRATQEHIFNFAVDYQSKHPKIAPLHQFELTDKDFDSFLDFLQGQNYNYQSKSEKILATLEKNITKERYQELLASEINTIKNNIADAGIKELEQQKKRLLQHLQKQIAGFYYHRKGVVVAGLKNDVEIKKAIEIMNNKTNYQNIFIKK